MNVILHTDSERTQVYNITTITYILLSAVVLNIATLIISIFYLSHIYTLMVDRVLRVVG